MSDNRETILAHIMSILGEVVGAQLVTDNMRVALSAAPDELPAVCLVDLGDTTEAEENHPYGTNHCEMRFAALCVIEGTTELLARSELGAFRSLVNAKIYEKTFLCPVVDWFQQTGKSHVAYPQKSPKVVTQGTEFALRYLEQYEVGMRIQ